MIYILAIVIVLGILLYLNFLQKKKAGMEAIANPLKETPKIDADCCGAHEVCDFDESDFDEEVIIYFEDQELDALRNVRESDLTAEQIDDIREVLYTLKPNEINKWLTSLGRRHIHLPSILQQEARQLIAES